MMGLPSTVFAQEHLKSLNASGIDKTTPASKDFYQHVNKGWMESNPLTPGIHATDNSTSSATQATTECDAL